MNGVSIESALQRIDAALARLESVADRPEQADLALQTRHDRLREAVAQSLRQLDDLLEGREQ